MMEAKFAEKWPPVDKAAYREPWSGKDLALANTDPDEAANLQYLLDNFVGTLPRMMYTLFKLLVAEPV